MKVRVVLRPVHIRLMHLTRRQNALNAIVAHARKNASNALSCVCYWYILNSSCERFRRKMWCRRPYWRYHSIEVLYFKSGPWTSSTKYGSGWGQACTHFCHNTWIYVNIFLVAQSMKELMRPSCAAPSFECEHNAHPIVFTMVKLLIWVWLTSPSWCPRNQILKPVCRNTCDTFGTIAYIFSKSTRISASLSICRVKCVIASSCAILGFQTGVRHHHIYVSPVRVRRGVDAGVEGLQHGFDIWGDSKGRGTAHWSRWSIGGINLFLIV